MKKNSPEIMHKGNAPQQAKAIYNKLTASIIFNGEKPKAFSLRAGTIEECLRWYFYSTQFGKFQPQQSEKKKKYSDPQQKKSKTVTVCR